MGNQNSGPRRLPNHLQVLKGVTRADRLNPAEPEPPSGEVVKPGDLSPGASEVWDREAPLAMGMLTLTAADCTAFKTYCEMQATFTANAQLKGTDKFSSRLECELATKLRPYYETFGFTATGRARIRVRKTEDDKPASKWAGVLK